MGITDDKKRTKEEDAAADAWGATATPAGGGGQVYMGRQHGDSGRPSEPVWMDTVNAESDFENWTGKQQQDFLSKLIVGGRVKYGAGLMEASAQWRKLVAESARYGAKGREISPFDILGSYVAAAGGEQRGQWRISADGRFQENLLTGEKKYIGPQFQTQTSTNTDFTDPATARAIAISVFQNLMGRNPGKGEIGTFAAALSQAEEASPVTASQTTEYDPTTGEALGTNTVTSGGVSADAKALLAEEQAKKNPEYGVVQAATTYSNALENAVWGAPG